MKLFGIGLMVIGALALNILLADGEAMTNFIVGGGLTIYGVGAVLLGSDD